MPASWSSPGAGEGIDALDQRQQPAVPIGVQTVRPHDLGRAKIRDRAPQVRHIAPQLVVAGAVAEKLARIALPGLEARQAAIQLYEGTADLL